MRKKQESAALKIKIVEQGSYEKLVKLVGSTEIW
jgi:hypothetical protein